MLRAVSDSYKKILALAIVIVVLGFLFVVNPEQSLFAPKCPFWLLTGLECPSCGSQRAVHQFLHLNIIEGIRYNPFIFISIPYLFLVMWTHWFDPKQKHTRLKAFCRSKPVVYTYVVLFFAWWIGRNIM